MAFAAKGTILHPVDYDEPNPRKRLYIILGVAAVLLLAAGLAARPAYRWFKQWRALQMAEASAQALRSKDLKTAAEKAESAMRLWPWDARVTRQEARVLSAGNPAAALPMWLQTWSMSHEVGDLREVVNSAIRAANNPLAVEYFALLQKADPQNPATWFLEGEIRYNQQQWPEALAALKKVIDAPDAPPEAHFLYATAAVHTADPVLAREGLSHLNALTERTDQLGLGALRVLGTYDALSATDAGVVATKLQNHPLATRGDKLLALRLSSRQPGVDEASLIKAAHSLFPPNDPDALDIVGLWLMSQGKYAAVLQLIDSETALTRKDLFLLRSDAMAALGQWQAIEQSLSSTNPRPPLPEAERLLCEARALTELGQGPSAQLAWERIVNAVGNEPAKLYDVAMYAVKLKLDDIARPAFQRLLKTAERRREAFEQLIHLEIRAHNTAAVHQLLLELGKDFPDDAFAQNDTLYTGFLLGTAEPDKLAAAHKLVADSKVPYLSYRVTLALGLLIAGQPADALKVFDGVTASTWPTTTPGWNAVYVGVLRANGQRDLASRIEQSIKADDLLPEEKKLLAIPLPPEVVK